MTVRSLQLMAGSPAGGAETFYITLGAALKAAGEDVHFGMRPHPHREAQLREVGADPHLFSFGHFDLATRWGLKRLVKDLQPDIVMTWMNRAAALCPDGDFIRVARLGGFYKMKHYRKHDHMIGNVPGIVTYLKECGWSDNQVHYVPNFCTVNDSAAMPRANFDTPEDVPLLLAMGRLHPAKGLDVLINAMPNVPKAHLWIAGEGPLRKELATLSHSLGLEDRVKFIGWQTDRTALLKAADVCVFPSRYEPLGNVMLEAWAHGVPLVAAASNGPSELMHDQQGGLLVPIDDADAIATAVNKVLQNPDLAQELVGNGAKRHRTEFNEAIITQRYHALYEEIVRTR